MALSLPLLVVLAVRYYSSNDFQNIFFTQLTDVVVLSAFLKFGVDSYLQGAKIVGERIQVDEKWRKGWFFILCALLLLTIQGLFYSSTWVLFSAVLLVLISYQFAEIGRLQENYLKFYLLKAPAVYVVVLVLVIITHRFDEVSFLVGIILLASLIYAYRGMDTVEGDIDSIGIAQSWLVSVVVILFSWKEAVISRLLFDGSELPELVMYTRLLVVITFPFMLYNARIPNRLRTLSESKIQPNAISDVIKDGRMKNIIWAVGSSLPIVIFSSVFDREHTVSVAILLISGWLLVYFGNIQSAFIYLRSYRAVVLCVFIGLCSFVCLVAFLGVILSIAPFPSIATASCASQLVVGLFYWRMLKQEKYSLTNSTNLD